jgi:PAS domain-containing protein
MPDQTRRDGVPSGTEGLVNGGRGEVPGRVEDPRAVLDSLPAVIGYYGTDLHNRLANRAYLEFFGRTPDEILGRHISEVVGSELYGLNHPHIEGALSPASRNCSIGRSSTATVTRATCSSPTSLTSVTGKCGASRCC